MKLSDNIQSLLEEYQNQPLPLGKVLECTGEKGFGLISGLLTLPMLIPIPVPLAGFSTLVGAGIIFIGLQLALGARQPRLPSFIARLELSPAFSQALLSNLNRILHPLERLARTRLVVVSRHRLLRRFHGICLVWNAILLALPLPVPFTNLLPAYTILVFAIGLLESDGLLLLIGYGLTGATTTFFASIITGIVLLLMYLG